MNKRSLLLQQGCRIHMIYNMYAVLSAINSDTLKVAFLAFVLV